ncbi:hypothetical protein CY34DRAFT_146329 [Suillus luteus UH-Slu-Lm8-n1]|uniref:Uncharacterized protein n=1 Tax=Suillus luteus UH-Slu-Lm8-n1 TaxID=930992 RepID=A0A0D0AX71_9AGAM|nr:hypothetical protein CY34DRAFT_146329 [Suillus luteus UH-Slu-Lm8-n1]
MSTRWHTSHVLLSPSNIIPRILLPGYHPEYRQCLAQTIDLDLDPHSGQSLSKSPIWFPARLSLPISLKF